MEYEPRNNQNEHLWKIADRRVNRIKEEYEQMGYKVWANYKNHEGVDIIIISNPQGRVVKVIESTNYAERTREGKLEVIPRDKLERYYGSLNYWDGIEGLEKEIVVSYRTNMPSSWYDKFRTVKITVVIKGYQD
jgi:hypothetical protein